jgi:DNA-binding beta-propeller fold protein YncE
MLQIYLTAAAGLADWVPPNLPPVNSTAWSLQNPVWDGQNTYPKYDFTAAGVTGTKGPHTWSSDGLRLFLILKSETSGIIREFVLESAYALGTMSVGISFDTGSNNLAGLAFNSTGTRLYVVRSRYNYYDSQLLQFNLSTAFDLSTAVLTRTFDLYAPMLAPKILGFSGIDIKPDGTQFFITARIFGTSSNDCVLSYTASTPYEINTLTWDGRTVYPKISFDTSGSGRPNFNYSPQGLAINPDGTKLYSLSGNRVYLYRLATPNAIGEITSVSSLSISSETSNARDLAVSPDGHRIYVINDLTDRVHQYNVSNPDDLATAGYANKSFSVGTGSGFDETQPTGLAVSSEGRYLYFIGSTKDTVFQIEMTNYWELDSAGFVGANTYFRFTPMTASTNIQGVAYSNDGSKIFVLSASQLRQFNCLTPYSLWGLTLAYTHSFGRSDAVCMRFDASGNKLFILFDNNTVGIREYSLGGAFDLSSFSYTGLSLPTKIVSGFYSAGGFDFGNYGYYLYFTGNRSGSSGRFTFQVNLTSPYNLNGAVYTKSRSSEPTEIVCVNESIYYFSNYNIQELGLSNSEINSAQTYLRSGSLFSSAVGNFGSAYALAISSGGDYVMVGTSNGEIIQYRLTTPLNISTIQNPVANSGSSSGFFRSTVTPAPTSLSFSPNGNYFYVTNVSDNNYRIQMYACASPWQVGGSSLITNSSLPSAYGSAFSNDGNWLFFSTVSYIERRPLPSAYNVSSTTTVSDAFNTGYYRIGLSTADLKFNPTGTRWYTCYSNGTYEYLYQYTTSTAYSVANAVGQSQYYSTDLVTGSPRGVSFPTARRIFQNDDTQLLSGTATADYTLNGYVRDNLYNGTGYRQLASARNFRLSPDGTKLFAIYSSTSIGGFVLNTAGDISTLSTNSVSATVTGGSTTYNRFTAFTISSDGLKWFAVQNRDYGSEIVSEYNFGSSYSVAGSSFVRSANFGGVGIAFSTDGSRMFLLQSNFRINVYLLSTGYNIATAVFDSYVNLPTGDIPSSGRAATDMVFRADGKKLIVAATANGRAYVNEYTNIISWTPSTANWLRTFSAWHPSNNLTSPVAMDISPNGQKLYLMGNSKASSTATVFQYTLYTPI